MTLLRPLLGKYGFNYSGRKLSLTFDCEMSTDNMTTPATVSMTVGLQFLNNGAKDFLLDKSHRLAAMWKLHVKRDVGWILKHIVARLIVWEDGVPISENKGIKLSTREIKKKNIVRHDSMFVDLVKTI